MIDFKKKETKILIAVIVIIVAVIGTVFGMNKNVSSSLGIIGGADGPTSIFLEDSDGETETYDFDEVDKAISEYLISSNNGKYMEGEHSSEGHVYLGIENRNDKLYVYLMTSFGEYGFQNNNFIKISGTGAIPAAVTMSNDYKIENIQYPLDGARYEESLKSIFPNYYIEIIKSADYSNELKKMEEENAGKYLSEIGRNAKIGEYRDFEHILLEHEGVNVEVSNKIFEYEELGKYPYWIGSQEYIEDGTRYVYEMSYNKELNLICFVKYEYLTGDISESIYMDAGTGQIIKE